MTIIDEEYLRKTSFHLRNFKAKGNHTYAWSCNICGDSKKKKSITRMGAYYRSGKFLVSCYNCGYSSLFSNWLKHTDPMLYKEYIVANFGKKMDKEVKEFDAVDYFGVQTKKYVPNIFSSLTELKYLPDENLGKKVSLERKLPIDKREIYYVENFIEWTKGHTDKFTNWRDGDHSRIIIPFKARDGHYIGYTARALKGEEPKYIRIFIDENEKERFYGIDLLDEKRQVYVVEGEIDAMFIPNAIAVSNGKLDCYFNKDAIYIPDADKRNIHIVKNIAGLLDKGLKVCLFPDDAPGKDINDCIKAGYSIDKVMNMIDNNVYQGLIGKLKFLTWSKV